MGNGAGWRGGADGFQVGGMRTPTTYERCMHGLMVAIVALAALAGVMQMRILKRAVGEIRDAIANEGNGQ